MRPQGTLLGRRKQLPRRAANGRTDLKATQKRVLAALEDDGSARLTRGLYEEIAGVSRSQAAYDLAELVSGGILERIGGGRSTWYRVVRQERPGQRRWTNDTIRAALEQFCGGRETWPSASEFKEAGHSDLYVAASRYGGIAFWTNELGFSRPARTTAPAKPLAAAPAARPRDGARSCAWRRRASPSRRRSSLPAAPPSTPGTARAFTTPPHPAQLRARAPP